MYQFISRLLYDIGLAINFGISAASLSAIARAIAIVSGIIIFILLRFLIRTIAEKFLGRINRRVENIWIEAAIESRLFRSISNISFPVVVYLFTYDMPNQGFWDKTVEISLVIIVMMLFISSMRIINKVYDSYEMSKSFPIHGVLQVAKIVVFIVGSIVVISTFVDQSPVMLLGSVGAVTAVASIVFKDAILGFMAGIHLTVTGMIKIGDRLELPRHSADGIIIDLSMMTVTIENHDKTTTSIPAYTLISEEFINWRGIKDTGARRMKRALFVDVTGICVCDDEMLVKFRKIELLDEYFNAITDTDAETLINLGVFREYVKAYVAAHPNIRPDLPLVVRHLEADGKGIPVEIYAFTNVTVLAEFEAVQSAIFDHLYAMLPKFGLELYQSPSSSSVKFGYAPDGDD